MTLLVFNYIYRIDMNIERFMPCSKKHNLHFKNILSSNNKSKQQSTLKSKQHSMTNSRCKYIALYNLIFSYLYVDFYLRSFSLKVCLNLLFESTLTYFFFILNSYLVYCYASSTHCIYVFPFNSDILSFGK